MRRSLGVSPAGALCVLAIASLSVVLAACGGSSSSSGSSASTAQGTTSASTSTGAATTSGSGGTTATPACATSGLAVRVGANGSGAAGSVYYPMTFTNQSGHACTLYGYPGVSGVNASGSQLGSPAGRDATSSPQTVTLAGGAVASATLQITDVANFTSSTCVPTHAAGLRVYVPNQTASQVVAFSFQACAKAGPVYLHVSPVSLSSSTAPPNSGGTTTTAACTTSGVVIRVGTNGSGTAGSVYYPMSFTNQSGHACTLYGYPGVSAVNASGSQLGSAASRDTISAPATVILANGAAASATLQINDVGNFTSSTCVPTHAAGLRVYVPNQTASKVVTFSFDACSKAGPVYLHVSAVT